MQSCLMWTTKAPRAFVRYRALLASTMSSDILLTLDCKSEEKPFAIHLLDPFLSLLSQAAILMRAWDLAH